ncbi:hypothetical protein BDV23DRAFT_182400 [Aspergillus alliaceus]|uniref:Uncharacterized protein n=1 Tax=Petromyces alliaceus TaxID=209559 RepID=A0A5N7CCX9_PETAA|nr:hypothetical protein BDV23DRAFT_182400 [Aspergillus alliaceus]
MSWLRAFIDWLGCGDSDLTPRSAHGLIYEETTTTTVKHDNTENIISESRITVMTKDLTTDSVSDRSTLVGNTGMDTRLCTLLGEFAGSIIMIGVNTDDIFLYKGEASIPEAPTRPSSPFDNCPVTLQHIRLAGDTILLLPDPDLSETMGETGMEHKYYL